MNKSEIRQKAEALLRKNYPVDELTVDEKTSKIIEELRVHQIELELQNDELLKSQRKLQSAQRKYQDLYNFAPVGYITFDQHGLIVEINLTATQLLQQPRQRLIGRTLVPYLTSNSINLFHQHCREVLEKGDTIKTETCELIFKEEPGLPQYIQLESIAAANQAGEITYIRSVMLDITARKKAEINLLQLKTAVETISLGVTITDLDGRIIYTNPADAHMHGYQVDELIGQDVGIFAPTEQRQPMSLQQLKRRRNNARESLNVRRDGTAFPVWLISAIVKDEKGNPLAVVSTCEDITQRKQAEEQLRKLSRAVEHSPASIVITDPNGVIEYVNPKFIQLTGYTAEEALGQNPRILKSGQHSAEFYADMWQTILNGQQWQKEIINRKKNGELYWEIISISPIRDQTGQITHFVGIKEDITERKRAEELLQEHLNFLNTLLNTIPNPIFYKDAQGCYLGCNIAFEKVIGLPEKQIIGKTLSDLAPHHMVNRQITAEEKLLKEGGVHVYESQVHYADGSLREVIVHEATFSNSAGEIQGLVGMMLDISERKQMESTMKRSQQFLNNILNHVPDPIFVKDQAHRLTFLNDAFCELAGSPREQLIGKSSYHIFPKEEAHFSWQEDNFVFTTGKSTENEKSFTDATGFRHTVSTKKAAFEDANGNKVLVGVIRNITQSKQIEEALRESQAFVYKINKTTPNIVYVFDLIKQRNIYTNRHLSSVLGYSPTEIEKMGRDIFINLVHPDDLPMVQAKYEKFTTIEDGDIVETEYRMRHSKGDWRWLWSRETVFSRDAARQPTQLLGVIQDITHRKQVEIELLEQNHFIENIANTSPVMLYIYSLTEKHNIYINHAIYDILGYSLDEINSLENDFFAGLMHPEDFAIKLPTHLTNLEQSQDNEIFELIYRLKHKNGDWRWLHSRDVVFKRTETGKLNQILGAAQDITDHRHTEAALNQANEILHQLAIMDGVTQVANRARFDEYLDIKWEDLADKSGPISVILCDPDFFKNYNDTYGYQMGDDCLRQIAQAINQVAKQYEGLVARYSNKIFATILPQLTVEQAHQVAEAIQHDIEQLQIEHQSSPINDYITLSIGVATTEPRLNNDVTTLLEPAHQALSEAKQKGRNLIISKSV